jgi:HEAT repeat protein
MAEIPRLVRDLSSGDDELAEKSVKLLIALKDDSLRYLLELRKSPVDDARWWAYCALGQIPGAEAEWFIPGLHDNSAEVRESAAMALCHNPNPSAIRELIQSLSDDDRMVALLAGRALSTIGEEAVQDLVLAMENGTPSARIEAARALSTIKDPRVVPAFMKALNNGSELVKFWAEQGLENMSTEMVYFKPG